MQHPAVPLGWSLSHQARVTNQGVAPVGSWTMGKAGTKIFQVEAITWISHLSSEQQQQRENGNAAVQGAHRHPAGYQNIHSSVFPPEHTGS